MNNTFSFNIDHNIFNIFSSKSLDELIIEYNLNNYCYLNQIHSNIAVIVDDNYINNLKADALITNLKNTKLVIKTADCIPILLYDKQNKVISLIHCGWRGVINDIVLVTVSKMIKKYNTDTKNIYAYIYPSIRKCHFEVSEDTYNKFKNHIENIAKYTKQKELKYYIDLQNIIIDKLKTLGITNIKDSNICTYCSNNKYHSYRYNKTDKRNYLIAFIKKGVYDENN